LETASSDMKGAGSGAAAGAGVAETKVTAEAMAKRAAVNFMVKVVCSIDMKMLCKCLVMGG
jgi:hypothetical protein